MPAALFIATIAAWLIAWGVLLALLSTRAPRRGARAPFTLLDQPEAGA